MRVAYDSYNDVLRVYLTPEPVASIAVPMDGVTFLVAESLDRIVGVVFEHYADTALRRIPDAARSLSHEDLMALSMEIVENIVPELLAGVAPLVKDRVAEWMETTRGL